MKLKVSDNGRFLVYANGEPFFYLADTEWELFHRLTYEEADLVLTTRAAQGFTAVQAVVLAELDGIRTPNAYGDLPLIDEDPTRLNEPYFAFVDRVIARANELGITVVLLPTWGDKWNKKWGTGPEIFTVENAFTYGELLGKRYRDANLIWMLGGDRPYDTEVHVEITRAMAAGVRSGDEGDHLITLHPMGGFHSSQTVHAEPWLDFNTIQSGHGRANDANYSMIALDYALVPTKPATEAESAYEEHPINWKPEELGYFSAVEVRRPTYWGMFAGGHGFTYGHHTIWQFLTDDRSPIGFARGNWKDALQHPVANQVVHVKNLMLSRPYLTRIPDPALIVGDPGEGAEHVEATRDADGSYAFVYFPGPKTVEVDLSRLSGDAKRISWFDVRTGEVVDGGETLAKGYQAFTSPSTEVSPDWVLVLDDASRTFLPPGTLA